MKTISHKSAKPSHYDFQSKEYDLICEEGSKVINQTVESILKKYRIKTVLDVTCGTVNEKGVLASFTTLYTKKGKAKTKVKIDTQTLQVYTIKQLKDMLEKNGFNMLRHCNVDGTRFSDSKSERMLVVAKKVGE
jgi:hypothetical protein